jgi:hypothetical protein
VIKVMVDMTTFFSGICETTLTPKALDRLQEHACMTVFDGIDIPPQLLY